MFMRVRKGIVDARESQPPASNMWDALAKIDESLALSAQRDETVDDAPRRRESDPLEGEDTVRLPLRILQEMNGAPIGFEPPKLQP